MLVERGGLICPLELDRKKERKKGGIEGGSIITSGGKAKQKTSFGSSKERGRKDSKRDPGFDCTTQFGKESIMTN